MRNFLIGLLMAASGVSAAFAQDQPQSPIVHAELLLHTQHVNAGESIRAGVLFTLPEGWHIYWQNPGDSGLATSLEWTLPNGVTASGIQWPTPERIDTEGIINYGYSHKVVLPVELTADRDGAHGEVTVKASWLACKDICIPESAELHGALPDSNPQAGALLDAAVAQLPKPLPADVAGAEVWGDEVTLSFDADRLSSQFGQQSIVEWFPVEDGVISNAQKPRLTCNESALEPATCALVFARGGGEVPAVWHGVVTLRNHSSDEQLNFLVQAKTQQIDSANATKAESAIRPQQSALAVSSGAPLPLLLTLLFAFLGGLILNLMPCVLPVLSLKALALAKKSGAEARAARAQGIAYAAGVIASFLLIAAMMLAIKSTGAAIGWGFQLQEPGVVAGLALLMLLVALNLFGVLELPVLFGSAQTQQDNLIGSFFTGVLAVAVATPCTAPFMAPAIGATLTLPAPLTLAVFAALGLGMAAPFLLISAWPAARRYLPKPGAWMLRFKHALAFPMLATAAWLAWVLVQINGVGGLAILFASMLAVAWLIWWAHGTPHRAWRWPLALLAIAALVWGIAAQPPATAGHHAMAPHGEPFDAQRLQALRDEGIPVFVDATAAWCLTCKLNERVALDDAKVKALFAQKNVTLMVADWTMRDAEITKYLAQFGRNGVPLYVYYPSGGEPRLLPQLLTPSLVADAINQ